MNCLLLDVGSTFIKYSLYNDTKKEITERYKIDFPKALLDDGVHFEVAENEIAQRIFEIFDFAAKKECKKAFICVQMHGYFLKKNDKFSNYISWRDKRGEVNNSIAAKYDFRKNGTSLKKNLPVVSLLTYNTDFCDTEFFTLGSYLIYKLIGKNITHKTDGCASGFFDAETLKPIEVFPLLSLPTVLNDVTSVGTYKGINLYTPLGDHQVSFLGSGVAENGYLLNVGTACQVTTIENSDFYCEQCEARPYIYDGKALGTISGITGGGSLFKNGVDDKYIKEITKALEILPKKDTVVLGGGGAEIVYEALKMFFEKQNIKCIFAEKNIGERGLKMIADKNKIVVGTMLSEVPFYNMPIIFKNGGLEFFIIDNEHGSFDYSTVSAIITNAKLCDIKAIVRLPDNNRMNIIKFADMGAGGFLLPMTNCAADIKKVVEYAKYSPIGKRGISTNRAHTLYNPPELKFYMEQANKQMKVYAQIETVLGVENIDEILEVEGIDGVFIGPNDLSADMNCIGNNEPVFECIKTVSESCQKHNKPWGIITNGKALIEFAIKSGVNMISYGSEINMLKNESKKISEMF